MLRLFKSKLFLLIMATVIIVIIMAVSAGENSKINWLGNAIGIPLSPVQKVFSLTGEKVGSGFSFFKDTKALKDENKALRAEIDKLKKENMELQEYKIKNKELREALNLKTQLNEFDLVGANIIAKDMGNWFNVFTIDRGSNDGVVDKSPVVTSGGLVGSVINSGPFSSKIISIIDVGNTLSGRISKSREMVVIKGDSTLKDKGLCRMDYILSDVDIEVGDSIETSGVGGIYPKGILIGKVKEIIQADNELNGSAIIEPAVDFKRLEEVIVLKSKTNNNMIGSEGK